MHALYVLSVWLHVLSAIVWVGGMFFVAIVVVPLLRRGDRATASAFMHAAGVRFRAVGWTSFALLIATGTFQLAYRGVGVSDFVDPAFLSSPFGAAITWKLGFFALVLVVSVWHDFFVGPRATVAGQRDPGGAEALRLRRQASWIGRANALLALLIVLMAVFLVRGWPW